MVARPFSLKAWKKKLKSLGTVLANNGKKKAMVLDFLPDIYSASFNGNSGSPFRWNDSSPDPLKSVL